jgi:hypothetical protein
MHKKARARTLLVLGKTKEAIPARHQNHIIFEILSLNLELLHHHNIGLEDLEHGIERSRRVPWLISEWIPYPVHVPRRHP